MCCDPSMEYDWKTFKNSFFLLFTKLSIEWWTTLSQSITTGKYVIFMYKYINQKGALYFSKKHILFMSVFQKRLIQFRMAIKAYNWLCSTQLTCIKIFYTSVAAIQLYLLQNGGCKCLSKRFKCRWS